MPLSEVMYQDAAQDRLQRAFGCGRVPHAYLFSGPPGVGKEMLATRWAALMLCGDPRQTPAPASVSDEALQWHDACGRCDDCVMFAADTHPDFHRIYRRLAKVHPDREIRERKAVDLSVGVIRHFVIEKIGLRPSRGRAKVFIISEAERLSDEAQNALLKTLEEPPERSFLILSAASADVLLPTTRSRCHQVAFRRLPSDFVADQLVSGQGSSESAARFLAELVQGSLGTAVRFAGAGLPEKVPAVVRALQSASTDPLGTGKSLLEIAQGVAAAFKDQDSGAEVDTNAAREAQAAVLAMTSTVLRDVHRVLVGVGPTALPREPAMQALASCSTTRTVRKAIAAMSRAEWEIRSNANTALVFDSVGVAIGDCFGQASGGAVLTGRAESAR